MKSYEEYQREFYDNPEPRDILTRQFGSRTAALDFWVTTHVFDDAGIQGPWEPDTSEKLDAYLAGYHVLERLKFLECVYRTLKDFETRKFSLDL